jgi:predicted RNA-binding protein with PUA-like domain
VNHWLVKQEPEAYSFAQFTRDKTTAWTGVRNFQARNFLKAMAVGDEVLYYHSVSEKAVVGLATVAGSARPDPTVEPGEKGDWVCVELKAGRAFPRPVTLDEIKTRPGLKKMFLLSHSRLSVQPVTAAEAAEIKRLGKV